MSIKLLSAPVPEFDPAEAIQLWNMSGSQTRRPYFKETCKPMVQRLWKWSQPAKIFFSASKDDGSEARPVKPLSRGDSCEEAEENVGAKGNEDGE